MSSLVANPSTLSCYITILEMNSVVQDRTFNFIHDAEHFNANTTMSLMCKTFVVKPRGEKNTVHLCGVYFFI